MEEKLTPSQMDYSEFTEYLKAKSIPYSEEEYVDIDYWFTIVVTVTPESKKLKARYFDTEGGAQLKD